MKTSTLKNCIATLVQLRDVYESQLDARVLEELDEVIAALKDRVSDDNQYEEDLGVIGFRVLKLIEYIIKIVTNVTELMK
jgi:hypothetical protein